MKGTVLLANDTGCLPRSASDKKRYAPDVTSCRALSWFTGRGLGSDVAGANFMRLQILKTLSALRRWRLAALREAPPFSSGC